ITCSYRSSSSSRACRDSACTASVSTPMWKAGHCTPSSSAKKSVSIAIPFLTTVACRLNSSALCAWWSTLESTAKAGAATRSWNSCASPAPSTSLPFNRKPIATSPGRDRRSATSLANSSSVSSAIAPRKRWARNSICELFMTRCSMAEPCRSTSSMSARINGSPSRKQNNVSQERRRNILKFAGVVLSVLLSAIAVAQRNRQTAAVAYPPQLTSELKQLQQAALQSDYAWQQLAHLTDNIGPRPAGSPQPNFPPQYAPAELRNLGLNVTL